MLNVIKMQTHIKTVLIKQIFFLFVLDFKYEFGLVHIWFGVSDVSQSAPRWIYRSDSLTDIG